MYNTVKIVKANLEFGKMWGGQFQKAYFFLFEHMSNFGIISNF